jgi:hypothetical protein
MPVSADDPAAAGLWIDSLSKLENRYYTGLSWDERWLLYYWTENYGALLSEAAQLGAAERYALSEKVQPPADSLFEITDSLMYARRYESFRLSDTPLSDRGRKRFPYCSWNICSGLMEMKKNGQKNRCF